MTTELERMIRTLRDAQDARRRLDLVGLGDKGTILDATRAFKENLALRPFITDQDRIRAKARLVVGPFEELRLAGVFEHASQFSRELKRIASTLCLIEDHGDPRRSLKVLGSITIGTSLNKQVFQ